MSPDRTAADANPAKVAAEQSALRRIAALLARSVPPEEVFEAVVNEVRLLMDVDSAGLVRYDADVTGSVTGTVVAHSSKVDPPYISPGDTSPSEGHNINALVLRTGRPVRIENYTKVATGGPLVLQARAAGIQSAVGVPIQVRERFWGNVFVNVLHGQLPPDTEERVADFAALVASALANVQAWSELEASRMRIISAADEARRRVMRDLHDGAQQRILALAYKARMLAETEAAQTAGLDADLRSFDVDLIGVLDELRTLASGLHPAALSRGGLAPALSTLARRSPVPVVLDIRLPGGVIESVEVAAYYVVAETLSNATKHAGASRVDVTIELRDRHLRICVQDDGVGGADPAFGSGLVGLRDRIEAFGGTMTLDSPSGGGGTTLIARLPLPENLPLDAEPANA